MQLWFGNFSFPINGCEVTSRTSLIRSSTGRPVRYRMALDVLAYLDAIGQANLTLLENLARVALAVPYRDLVLKQDSGANSSLALVSNNSVSGVVITDGPNFGEAQGAEFVTRRTCRFTGEAEYPIAGTADAVLSFEETLIYQGTGGPVTNWRYAVNGPPVQQIVYPASTVKLTQVGTAIGHLRRPAPAAPLFPLSVEKQEERRITRISPKRIGPGAAGLVEWGVSWVYQFESDRPLVALPSIPPL